MIRFCLKDVIIRYKLIFLDELFRRFWTMKLRRIAEEFSVNTLVTQKVLGRKTLETLKLLDSRNYYFFVGFVVAGVEFFI